MSDPARTAVCVALLARDETARLLVLSWPLVDPALLGREALLAWARASGISIHLVERKAAVLFAHAICLPDRSVDPEATKVCQHIAANYLRSTSGGKR